MIKDGAFELKKQEGDSDHLIRVAELFESRFGDVACWVCRQKNWTGLASPKSFGAVTSALGRDLISQSDEQLPMAVACCQTCGNLWFISIAVLIEQGATGEEHVDAE